MCPLAMSERGRQRQTCTRAAFRRSFVRKSAQTLKGFAPCLSSLFTKARRGTLYLQRRKWWLRKWPVNRLLLHRLQTQRWWPRSIEALGTRGKNMKRETMREPPATQSE